jgi:hypothetical protein
MRVAPILAGTGFVVEGVLAVVHPVGDSGWDLLAEMYARNPFRGITGSRGAGVVSRLWVCCQVVGAG